ncbi:hypothetical protein BC939DRAFT_502957 [Gamsiella multidivaricata]|uniref:uncharacterized protein n=1 Tax=Gamsiella multidivaricata TaxID=101098 RepID=UPI00221EBF55|nr:uncharacterized protein BC939DRAFT_502957 [Gamsiella multidivaricata]KAG0364076.1 hypothetical protein BGZ54_007861 [Gamsiella multidivaricata]KAI7824157.1 hypothetical protein BC939DRAFT_502957 [Gamsiella multidivaricata]
MFKHVYPAWHKPAQRVLFVIAAIFCITLPAIYGSSRKPRKISAKAMGAVFGVYFGLWALFSLLVRFLVPSPKTESTLPTYDPSPIPEPAVLYSPSRADALPTSPAIRLHPSSGPTAVRGARFADSDEIIQPLEDISNLDSPPNPKHPTNNVTFQVRPQGSRADSSTSEAAYPTFAAYRQSQHGNFDAFAQRLKRTFATSQQQQQKQPEQQGQEQSVQQIAGESTGAGSEGVHLQPLMPDGTNKSVNTRSRSGSAASILEDLAERIRNGSIFSRSQNLGSTQPSTDPTTAITTAQGVDPTLASSRSSRSSLGRFSGILGGNGTGGPEEVPTIEVIAPESSHMRKDLKQGQHREHGYDRGEEAQPLSLSNIAPQGSEAEKK